MFVCPECGAPAAREGVCARDGAGLAAVGGDDLLGCTIGKFRIAARLGEGGMGAVYKAVHSEIGSRVAIKVVHEDVALDEAAVARCFAEARAVAAIHYEGIVQIFDVDRAPDGRPCIVMEYLEGETLGALIESESPLAVERVIGIVCDLCDALAAAHARGVVHRDVKPHNVFVTKSGRAKLLDFGVAKLTHARGHGADELQPLSTISGALVGTPNYLAPEHVRGEPVDARSDLYAVGVVLFEALTGRKLFVADALYEVLRLHAEAPAPRLARYRPDAGAALDAVVARAVAKRPEERYDGALALRDALRDALRNAQSQARAPQGASVPSPALAHRSRKPLPRSAVWLGGAAVVVVAGVVTLVAALGARGQASGPPQPPPIDHRRFDPSAALAPIEHWVATSYGDARLTFIALRGLDAGGHIDLAVAPDHLANFYFVTRDGSCVLASAAAHGLHLVIGASACSNYAVAPPPRCSVARILERVHAHPKRYDASFSLDEGAGFWIVTATDGATVERLPDDC